MDEEITCYYSDATLQLKINLRNIRKELLSMLDAFEQENCLECYQLKCKCTNETKSESGLNDANKNDTNNKEQTKSSPPAASLPKPKWDVPSNKENPGSSTPKKAVQQDIKAWIDAWNKIEDDKHVLKEAPLLSLTEKLVLVDKEKKPQVAINYVNNGGVVEAFFKYFQAPSTTAVTYVSAKLAAACNNSGKQSYSYF